MEFMTGNIGHHSSLHVLESLPLEKRNLAHRIHLLFHSSGVQLFPFAGQSPRAPNSTGCFQHYSLHHGTTKRQAGEMCAPIHVQVHLPLTAHHVPVPLCCCRLPAFTYTANTCTRDPEPSGSEAVRPRTSSPRLARQSRAEHEPYRGLACAAVVAISQRAHLHDHRRRTRHGWGRHDVRWDLKEPIKVCVEPSRSLFPGVVQRAVPAANGADISVGPHGNDGHLSRFETARAEPLVRTRLAARVELWAVI